jgi:fatty acid desaturase
METNTTDDMLKNFFSENKQEIADNGFTQRVMRHLPEQADHSWIVWIFAAIGMAISIYLGINFGLIEHIMLLIKQIPIYYILGGIFYFPLLGSAGFYLSQNTVDALNC